LDILSIGLAEYPPKVARRLRGVTVAAFAGIGLSVLFAVLYAIEAGPEMRVPLLINVVDAFALAGVPWLHRFGPLAGANAVLAITCAGVYGLAASLGRDAGLQFYFLAAPAMAILFFGPGRVALSAVWAAVGAALLVTVEIAVPPNAGLRTPGELLYGNLLPTVVASAALLFGIVLYAVRQMARAEDAAEAEHARSEALLSQIMPASVAARLKSGAVVADHYAEASIMFADMAGFTARAATSTPRDLVEFLDRVYSTFDELVASHGLEKIKTTGDSYMVVSGLPEVRADHAAALARLALALGEHAQGAGLAIRIGLACGPVVAGVVGRQKYFYDVWGDAVNMASRMEATGEPGRIQVSEEMHEQLRRGFILEKRGRVDVRGKGAVETWFLLGKQEDMTPALAP
jgi:adenylate cyclase